ncbi:hypothetical protein IG631_19095 [Alternaria alternata]|nr:hypothetical protein IG631_19095 [Alternaria alternata]
MAPIPHLYPAPVPSSFSILYLKASACATTREYHIWGAVILRTSSFGAVELARAASNAQTPE